MTHPVYYGVFDFAGERHAGTHEPLISKDLFDRVLEVTARRTKPKTPTLKPYVYRGLLRCGECGCWVTTETQKGHNYLHCTKRVKRDCAQPYVREEVIASQIDKTLRSAGVPLEWIDDMLAEMREEQDTDILSHQRDLAAIREQIARVDTKLDRLLGAYLDQDLAADEYRQAKANLVGEKNDVTSRLAAAEREGGKRFEPGIRFANALRESR